MFRRTSPRNKTSSSKEIDLPVSPLPTTLSVSKMKKNIVLPSQDPSPVLTETNERLNSSQRSTLLPSLCQFPKSHPGKVCLCQFPKSEVKIISGDFEPSQIELHPIRNNNSILVLEFKVINFWYDWLCKLYGQTLTTRQLFVTKSMV